MSARYPDREAENSHGPDSNKTIIIVLAVGVGVFFGIIIVPILNFFGITLETLIR